MAARLLVHRLTIDIRTPPRLDAGVRSFVDPELDLVRDARGDRHRSGVT